VTQIDDIGPSEQAVNRLADTLDDVDPDQLARLEAARAVARQLDRNSQARTGSAGMATAVLAREFRAILHELAQQQQDAEWDGLVGRLTADE
jgi:hypothetical protein